jgi:hypothetical protein
MGANRRSLPRRWRDGARRCRATARQLPAAFVRFARLPAGDRRATIRALATLLVVESTIRWVRLPRLARMLGVDLQARPPTFPPPSVATVIRSGDDLAEPLARARRSVARLMAIWPFGAGPCLRESLVLGHLVREHHPVLRLGVARHGRRPRAHAWIEVDDLALNDPEGFVAFGATSADAAHP